MLIRVGAMTTRLPLKLHPDGPRDAAAAAAVINQR